MAYIWSSMPLVLTQNPVSLEKLAADIIERRNQENDHGGNNLQNLLLYIAEGVEMFLEYLPQKDHPHALYYRDPLSDLARIRFKRRNLNRDIKRLQNRGLIRSHKSQQGDRLTLTAKGRSEILFLASESITIQKPAEWDRKWRIVIYDIFTDKKFIRNRFQKILGSSGFFRLQRSVYLHPFPCEEKIDLLRRYLGINGEVRLILAEDIEDDQELRDFFNL
jgi:CRISPR-associated endonuclease Cas2